MQRLLLILIAVGVSSGLVPAGAAPSGFTDTSNWVRSASPDHEYTIFVREEHSGDLPLTHEWVSYVYRLAEREYGAALGDLHVYLCDLGDDIKGAPPIWGPGAGWYNDDTDLPVPIIAMATPSLRPVDGCCDILRMPFSGSTRSDLIVHEAFHHLQSQVLVDRYLIPRWFFEGGATLAEWESGEEPALVLESLLDLFAANDANDFKLSDVVCCWSLESRRHLAPSFNSDYYPSWLFLAFAGEHCGDNFGNYKLNLTT